jgi:hypothetical protein
MSTIAVIALERLTMATIVVIASKRVTMPTIAVKLERQELCVAPTWRGKCQSDFMTLPSALP